MAHGMDMQGPNVFAKEHYELQNRNFMDVVQDIGSAGLEHLVVQPVGRLLTAAGAVLHLNGR